VYTSDGDDECRIWSQHLLREERKWEDGRKKELALALKQQKQRRLADVDEERDMYLGELKKVAEDRADGLNSGRE